MSMNTASDIGHRIRHARKAAALTQKELAERVGYSSANYISKLESGQMPSIENALLLHHLAVATGVDVSFLMFGQTQPTLHDVMVELGEHRRLLEKILASG